MAIAGLQANIILGWTQVAISFGDSYSWYAPTTANEPIANAIGTLTCYFDRSPSFTARMASEYGKPEWFCAYDRTSDGPGVGDYISDGTDTYFIAAQDSLTPSKTISCNAQVDFYRPGTKAPLTPQQEDEYELTSDGGDGLAYATGWPISLLSGSRGERADSNLPSAGRQPWFNFRIPATSFFRPFTDDVMVDSEGLRYRISACDKEALGFFGTARLEMA